MIVSESLFPGYSVSGNRISDLGADCNAVCVINHPSAEIFDASVIILGLAGIFAGYMIFVSRHRVPGMLALVGGLGAIGVGVFPETTGEVHVLVSFVAFFFTGLAAIASFRLLVSPMSYLAVVLGTLTLVALVLYANGTYLGLGPGGMERMVAYPAVIWVIGAGGNLMGLARQNPP